jgi:hypothetical protein
MIYQHATAEADRMIADALDKRIEDSGKAANRGPDDDDGTAGTLAKTGEWHVNGTSTPVHDQDRGVLPSRSGA